MFLSLTGDRFEGFHGLSLGLLLAGAVLALLAVMAALARWYATRPEMPPAAPPSRDPGPETPAIVNLLIHRWRPTAAAMAATMLDLAARRWLEIDQLGDRRSVVRVRSDPPPGELTGYETRVLEWVRRQAIGGSAPMEALGFADDGDRERFWRAFREDVERHALAGGLARARWSPGDWALTGALLGGALAAVGSAFALARLGQERAGGDASIEPWHWLAVAGFAWLLAFGWLKTRKGLRDTAAGRTACAHWLGVRQALANDRAFDDLPPAAVTIWERYLAYGAALGLAREAVRDLPFEVDDPGTAWTRRGPTWQEIRVDYPVRFGFGRKPFDVLLEGLGRVALFGFVAFFVLPIVARVVVDALPDAFDASPEERWVRVFVAGVLLGATVAGVVLVVRFVDGAIKLWRGLLDLGSEETIEGTVIKAYQGRVAIDPGTGEETNAYAAGAIPAVVGEGVRVVRTPRLWFVKAVELRPASREGTRTVAVRRL